MNGPNQKESICVRRVIDQAGTPEDANRILLNLAKEFGRETFTGNYHIKCGLGNCGILLSSSGELLVDPDECAVDPVLS